MLSISDEVRVDWLDWNIILLGLKIIVQKKISILSCDNVESLKYKTQKLEYRAYPEALIKIFRYN